MPLAKYRKMVMWNDDDAQMAARMWSRGVSATTISKCLGGAHSRSSVISKMFRMGVQTPAMPPQGKPKNPRPKRQPRPPKMTAEERVVKYHNEGISPRDIACRQGVRKHVVVEILKNLDLDAEEHEPRQFAVHPMWSMNEDDRRMAFYQKFQAGWAGVQERLNAR